MAVDKNDVLADNMLRDMAFRSVERMKWTLDDPSKVNFPGSKAFHCLQYIRWLIDVYVPLKSDSRQTNPDLKIADVIVKTVGPNGLADKPTFVWEEWTGKKLLESLDGVEELKAVGIHFTNGTILAALYDAKKETLLAWRSIFKSNDEDIAETLWDNHDAPIEKSINVMAFGPTMTKYGQINEHTLYNKEDSHLSDKLLNHYAVIQQAKLFLLCVIWKELPPNRLFAIAREGLHQWCNEIDPLVPA